MAQSTHSTISVVKTALVAQLRARAGLAGIQVSYKRPNDDDLERKSMWFGRAVGTHEITIERAGRKKRDESYALELTIAVEDPGDNPEEADEQVMALAGEVEDHLADDPTIGGVLPKPGWAVVSGFDLDPEPDEEGWASRAHLTIEVHNRLV